MAKSGKCGQFSYGFDCDCVWVIYLSISWSAIIAFHGLHGVEIEARFVEHIFCRPLWSSLPTIRHAT